MTEFTPLSALFGGALIGLSALILLYFNGKVAGVSGIVSRFIDPKNPGKQTQIAFIIGLVIAPLFLVGTEFSLATEFSDNTVLIVVAGLLVGMGSNLGNGCTSGHGICGMGRLSKRSIVATCVFMLTAFVTVFITKHLI